MLKGPILDGCIVQTSFSFSPQPSFDHLRDKTSPEKQATSTSSSPGEETTGEQRSFPPAQQTFREEGSPPASAKLGIEAGQPTSQGTVTLATVTGRAVFKRIPERYILGFCAY